MANVKVYTNKQAGAPSLTGQAGSLVAVLDACLVDGFGQVNASTVTHTNGTVTVVTAAAHNLEDGDYALISGATETDYNGEYKIDVVDATTFRYAITATPTSPATGTIAVKRAPAGFAKPFSGTNKAVYRSSDTSSARRFFRIDDNSPSPKGARGATIVGYRNMTDVDTGTSRFPDPGIHTDSSFHIRGVFKSHTSDATARNWIVISDGVTVYMSLFTGIAATEPLSASGEYHSRSFAGFGELSNTAAGDVYTSFVVGERDNYNNPNTARNCDVFYQTRTPKDPPTSIVPFSLDGNYNGIGSSIPGYTLGAGFETNVGYSSYYAYPDPITGGFTMAPIHVIQTELMRGRVPGMFESLCGYDALPNNYDLLNVQGYPGRKYKALKVQETSRDILILVDITGPWR